MGSMKEIRDRISSIKDIRKITNAMYLISSSKLKKAQKRLEQTVPYFVHLQSTIHDILRRTPDINHLYFDKREEKSEDERIVGYIVVTADKGLAGSYNHNVLKLADRELEKHKNTCLFVAGQVGRQYFKNRNITIDGEFLYTAQNPTLARARSIGGTVLDMFRKGYLDEVNIIYTRMENSVKLVPEVIKVLPLEHDDFSSRVKTNITDEAEFSPSPEKVLNHLVPNYVIGLIYGVLTEAFSSEQSARMMAMDSATQSADDMLKDLSLLYNRARQAAITQEITEVAAGAKAQKKKK
ncbi:MAG: ATP synthase F1 subunit gamma [Oscillospiraceae bacterium]